MTDTRKKHPDDIPYNKKLTFHGGRVITTTKRKERKTDIAIGIITAMVMAAIGAICLWLLAMNASDLAKKGAGGYVIILIGFAFSIGMFGYTIGFLSSVKNLIEDERNSH